MKFKLFENMKGGFNMNSKVIYTLLILGVLIIGWYIMDSNSPMVSAQGQAIIKAKPDEVSVYVSIETHNKTAQATQDTNSQIREEVLTALKQAGISNDSIQFQQYNIYPEYDWNNGRQTQKGYIASQMIVVKLTEFDKVAGVVDKTIASGGLVSNIQFELSQKKQNEYKTQALTDAGADAQTKASATAAGLGKKLGRLVAVQTSDFNYPGPIMYYAKAMMADSSGNSVAGTATAEDISALRQAASNISPQDIDVSATLQVQYKVSWF